MKKIFSALWVPVLIIGFFTFLWCIVFPWADCASKGKFSFKELNFPDTSQNQTLPVGYSLLYNSSTDKYLALVKDAEYENLILTLRVYRNIGMASEIWTTTQRNETATKFKSKKEAIYYANLWYRYQQETIFKPLTK